MVTSAIPYCATVIHPGDVLLPENDDRAIFTRSKKRELQESTGFDILVDISNSNSNSSNADRQPKKPKRRHWFDRASPIALVQGIENNVEGKHKIENFVDGLLRKRPDIGDLMVARALGIKYANHADNSFDSPPSGTTSQDIHRQLIVKNHVLDEAFKTDPDQIIQRVTVSDNDMILAGIIQRCMATSSGQQRLFTVLSGGFSNNPNILANRKRPGESRAAQYRQKQHVVAIREAFKNIGGPEEFRRAARLPETPLLIEGKKEDHFALASAHAMLSVNDQFNASFNPEFDGCSPQGTTSQVSGSNMSENSGPSTMRDCNWAAEEQEVGGHESSARIFLSTTPQEENRPAVVQMQNKNVCHLKDDKGNHDCFGITCNTEEEFDITPKPKGIDIVVAKANMICYGLEQQDWCTRTSAILQDDNIAAPPCANAAEREKVQMFPCTPSSSAKTYCVGITSKQKNSTVCHSNATSKLKLVRRRVSFSTDTKQPAAPMHPHSRRKKGTRKRKTAEEKRAEEREQCRQILGTATLQYFKTMNLRPEQQRPFLAALREPGLSIQRSSVEEVIGKITDQEWKNIAIHARYPGKHKSATKQMIFRNRIPTNKLDALVAFLDQPENCQKFAFGKQVKTILGDRGHVVLSNVARKRTVIDLAAQFVVGISGELEEIINDSGIVPPTNERCQKVEEKTFRRCQQERHHDGNCDFTPAQGSMSLWSARTLIRMLCPAEIGRLTGLDDTAVEKGRGNFQQLRALIEQYYVPGSKRDHMMDRIDKHEVFCQTDLTFHFKRQAEHACCCLDCGFYNDGSPEDIVCSLADKHLSSCKDCTDGFAIVLEIKARILDRMSSLKSMQNDTCHNAESIMMLLVEPTSTSKARQQATIKGYDKMNVKQLQEEIKQRGVHCVRKNKRKGDLIKQLIQSDDMQQEQASYARLSPQMRLELEELEEHFDEINTCLENLQEYRSHLARHAHERTYAEEELKNLADGEAIVTSDYKMKILACYFREGQQTWFGKSGTSGLGFMITTNPTDKDEKAKGIKNVTYVMLFTDDGFQDEWEIACGKAMVYREFLPKTVTKVHFVSDGASNFKSKLHKVILPFWKSWTGIVEVSNRVTPAGDGKTTLDGMFGKLMHLLQGTVDGGGSYHNAETILKALGTTNGLQGTVFRKFDPDRSNQVKAELSSQRIESILLTILEGPNKIRMFKHSGMGSGIEVNLQQQAEVFWNDPDHGASINNSKNGADCKHATQTKTIGSSTSTSRRCVVQNVYCHDGSLNRATLGQICPGYLRVEAITTAREGKSSSYKKTAAPRHVELQENRKNLVVEKADKLKEQELKERNTKEACGLFLCPACCPKTGRFCTHMFLKQKGCDDHVVRNNHHFPQGISASDYVKLQASKPGGSLSVASRPDRASRICNTVVVSSEPGVPGEYEARCIGRLNRKEHNQQYHKPPKLVAVLEELYMDPEKLNAATMHARLKAMRDPDGTRMFCKAKANTNGTLIREDQIASWIRSRTQQKKKKQLGRLDKDYKK